MNPTAIFSKSGKGVQEASGKTSSLSRPDRAVLSAIDGRATLAEVASKVGKQFDNDFRGIINKLDKDGFIREVSPGTASPGAKPGAAPAKPAPSKPTAPMDVGSDLDFTATMAITPKKGAAPPPQAVARAPAPPPKPTINIPPPPPPPSAAEVAKKAEIAKDQQSAFARAREEAEQKAQEQRDRLKAEAEAKVRAETEAKLRVEAEKKMKADAEAAAKKAEAEAAAARSAAIRAAAEAKIKAEAEAKRAREEAERAKREAEEKAERARREAEEKAERARKEAEEKARREQEELKRKLEEERRAREEAERKAKEEAERARRQLEEERRKMEEERKRLEEQQRREEAERAARRQREEEEEQQRRQREQQEEAERAARKQREEDDEQARAEREAADRIKENELSFDKLMAAQDAPAPPPPPAAKAPATGDAFADSLLADLDSFTQKDDAERKAKEEAERKAKEDALRRKVEEAERLEREAAEVRQREEAERRRKEEEAQRARDAEEQRARKAREEQEQAQREAEREAEERRKKMGAAAPAGGDDIGITDSDLDMDEVKKESALLEKKKDRKAEREKEREKEKALKKEREREAKSKKEKEREEKETKKAAAYKPRRKSHLGRNLFLSLIVLAAAGVGVAHVIPLSTDEYERAATEALGRPVKINSAHFSVIGGVQYRFEGVSIGNDFKVPTVRAFPELGSLIGDRTTYTRIELDGMTLPQSALGEVLFAKGAGDSLTVPQLTLKNLKLAGALPLPPLDGEVQLSGGGLRSATLRGPEGLVARLGAKEQGIEFEVNTSQFTLPFAQGITLIQFGMKGDATRLGMKISQWDGLLFSGKVTGTANLRWGNTWYLDGVMTARGVNAAVFAPALVSDGRADGTGRFTMSGVEPAKLSAGARLEGNFTVMKGVLGAVDLSRALQTGGRVVTGQTQFAEMSGQGVYDRGAISIRNVNLGAGALNAAASAEINERGELSGRIVADVRTSTQNLRSTLLLGGTVQEPQVRN